MKRPFFRLGAVAIALAFAAGYVGYAAVTGSSHDLSSGGPLTDASTDEDQICVFCHTPHNAGVAVPLWNHQATVAGYTVYDSSTMQATAGSPPGGISALCLSCHDGTVAVNNLYNPPNDLGADPTMGSGTELNASFQIDPNRPAYTGTDLSDDHPVSFAYDGTLAGDDGNLETPASTDWVDAGQTVPLFAGNLECASCHDPHDDTVEPFLVKSNGASALCKTCHQQ
jgi:predicted CXXCH cytochrome family protein